MPQASKPVTTQVPSGRASSDAAEGGAGDSAGLADGAAEGVGLEGGWAAASSTRPTASSTARPTEAMIPTTTSVNDRGQPLDVRTSNPCSRLRVPVDVPSEVRLERLSHRVRRVRGAHGAVMLEADLGRCA